MITQSFLEHGTKILQQHGIETARLDVLVLMEDVLGKSRGMLLAHPEMKIAEPELTQLNKYITRRSSHIPLAYIRGKVMFYGREFLVNNHVLVPRPETEAIIECLKKLPLGGTPRIADVGTGSGCLGITAALEIFGAEVFLYDIDPGALQVAEKNAQARHVMVHAKQQDLLKDCNEQFDAILANLPYVPESYPINEAAKFEPKLALFSGKDGLGHYRMLWEQIDVMADQQQPTHVITESMPEQHKELAKLAQGAGYRLLSIEGYAQQFVRLSATED